MRTAPLDAPAVPRRALPPEAPPRERRARFVRLTIEDDASAARHNAQLEPDPRAAAWVEAVSIGYVALAGSAALGLGIASVVLSR